MRLECFQIRDQSRAETRSGRVARYRAGAFDLADLADGLVDHGQRLGRRSNELGVISAHTHLLREILYGGAETL